MIDQAVARSDNATWHYTRWITGQIADAAYVKWVRTNLLGERP